MVVRYRKRQNFWKIDAVNGVIDFPITDLVRYYKLDDDMTEEVSSQDGTATNVSWVSAKINDGADFDGSTAYATFPNVLKDKTAYTISFWMKAGSIPGTNWWLVGSRPPGNPLISILLQSTGKILASLGTDTGAITSTNTLSTATRYMVTAVKDWASQTLYIDADSSKWWTGSTNVTYTSTNTRYMGRADSAAVWYYDGIIDEVWIRERALTQAEVTALYNSWNWLPYPL